MLGLGSTSVWSVPADPKTHDMDSSALSSLITKPTEEGYTPLYLSATAGTTVLGSYDPITTLAAICKQDNISLHIDASWGSPAIFSPAHKYKLKRSHLVDSIAIKPHKMMEASITCSSLLGAETRHFHASNTLPANYLFHSANPPSGEEVYDLADLRLQCGRRGNSLKLYLSWVYYGTEGYAQQIDAAFDIAVYLANVVSENSDLVCFYYAKGGNLRGSAEENGIVTKEIVQELVPRGFMIDYADVDKWGAFMRVVVSSGKGKGIVEGLVKAIVDLGGKAWREKKDWMSGKSVKSFSLDRRG